uniref:Vacuolar protein sorting-associated protein 13 DH-like domain-containing protein n=2 Tax=Ditylum brightwellii TaxID=49249 RepID=A0A7S4RS30_9STRA
MSNASSLLSQTDRSFLKRVRTYSRGDSNGECNSASGALIDHEPRIASDESSNSFNSRDEVNQSDQVNYLFNQGLLCHASESYFHHLHWTHSFRTELSIPQPLMMKTDLVIASKSHIKIPPSISLFKSWLIAQAFLNDKEVAERVIDTSSVKSSAMVLSTDTGISANTGTEKIEHKEAKAYLLDKESCLFDGFRLPLNAPTIMHQRARFSASELVESRLRFEKAAKLSLKSVLNPGGQLWIRPITALNLPDTYHGMFVKLRYNDEIVITQTVDSKVTPTWTSEGDADFPRRVQHFGEGTLVDVGDDGDFDKFTGLFKKRENDLSIDVRPLQTSGSIRLSVVGEKLQSKVELGVLQIPLGTALDCCNEVLEEHQKNISGSLDESGQRSNQSTPMYIRWFPLQNPKDTIPVEGDMGHATKSAESEKTGDNLFNQYYTPCIKLALFWEPSLDLKKNREDHVTPGDEEFTIGSRYKKWDPRAESYLHLSIRSISSALIDSSRALELLSLHINDFDIRYSVTKATTRLGVAVGWVQLDHQEEKAREPVVFSPTPVLLAQPTLIIETAKDNFRSKSNIDSYEYVHLAMQEVNIRLEESWIFSVWEFYVNVNRQREEKSKDRRYNNKGDVIGLQSDGSGVRNGGFSSWDSDANVTNCLLELLQEEKSKKTAPKPIKKLKKIYIQNLVLGAVRVNLSYIKSVKNHRGVDGTIEANSKVQHDALFIAQSTKQIEDPSGRSSHDNAESGQHLLENSQNNHIWTEESRVSSTNNIPDVISAVFPSITDAPVRMHAKIINHVFETPEEIVESLRGFYSNEILRQIYKIIGSLDFVGNPTMVLNSLVAGVRDFFLQPSRELKNSKDPSKVGVAFFKGTLSLLSHSATGLFGFTSKLSATAGQAAATISLDKQFKRWHAVQVANNAKRQYERIKVSQHLMALLTRPIQDIFVGVAFAASGVFVEPYRGAKTGGKKGLAKGIAIGSVGVVTKPLVGFFDAFAHFTESIHDIAKNVNILEKRFQPVRKLRLSYAFGVKNLLTPFDHVDARSIYLLHQFPISERRRHIAGISRGLGLGNKVSEFLVLSEKLHTEPGVELYPVVTTRRIVLFKIKKEGGGQFIPSREWEIVLNNMSDISSSLENRGHIGVVLYVVQRDHADNSSNISPMSPLGGQGPNETKESSINSASSFHGSYGFGEGFDGEGTNHIMGNSPQSTQFGLDDKVPAKAFAQQTGEAVSKGATYWQSEEKKSDSVQRRVVIGEFQRRAVIGEFRHRPQMARIHNAICCISEDFDSLIFDSGIGKEGTEGSNEGYTSFGYMKFEKDESSVEIDEIRKQRNVYTTLENTTWLHEGLYVQNFSRTQHSSLQQITPRKSWRFIDELEASKQEGGPDWLIQARARAMFVAHPLPPLPSHIDHSDEVVALVSDQLKMGLISADKAKVIIDSRAAVLARESTQPPSVEATTTGEGFDESQLILEREHDPDEISTPLQEVKSVSDDKEKQYDSLMKGDHPSSLIIDEVSEVEVSTQHTEQVENRLERLEMLLNELIQNKSTTSTAPPSASSAPVRMPVIPSAVESDISALPSFGGASLAEHVTGRQRVLIMERERLQAQIGDLEKQLADLEEMEESTIEPTSSETVGNKSIAKKVRRIFKKKKKRS